MDEVGLFTGKCCTVLLFYLWSFDQQRFLQIEGNFIELVHSIKLSSTIFADQKIKRHYIRKKVGLYLI